MRIEPLGRLFCWLGLHHWGSIIVSPDPYFSLPTYRQHCQRGTCSRKKYHLSGWKLSRN